MGGDGLLVACIDGGAGVAGRGLVGVVYARVFSTC